MSEETPKGETKASKSPKATVPVKKGVAKQPQKKANQQKFDFLNWIEMFASGVNLEKLKETIPQLNNDYQNLASELVMAGSDTKSKPTSKFKIEKLPIASVRAVRTRVKSPFYLIAMLCNSSIELELKKQIIVDLGKLKLSEEDIDYLLNKLIAIKDFNHQQIIWNEFLSNGVLLEGYWLDHQWKFLDCGFTHGLKIVNPIDTLIGLRKASDQFRNLDTPKRNKIYRKLLETDILTFIAFLLHISSENFTIKFIEQIIGKKNVVVLLTYLEYRQAFLGPWLDNFEQQFISPMLKSTLDALMRFEDLLPFILKQNYFLDLIPSDTLPRAVGRSYKREDELSKLLSDIRVEQLSNKVENLSVENSQISRQLEGELSRNQENEKRIKDFEAAIDNYETRLRSQMKSENLGSDAMSQTAKVEVIKSLVEGLDHLLQNSEGFMLERALQKIGILRLGDPGSTFTWDSELCETLTGVSMENGIVVRSGYTWLHGDKKIVIRRVLLKLA